MHLALRRARTNRAPADQVTDVLGRNHVQELAARGQADAVDVDQQLARDAQAFVDAVALIQVRVIDQPLPAHGGAGLLEVHPHHDLQRACVLRTHDLQAVGVFDGGVRIVDGAGANHHQQPVVGAGHDVVDVLAGGRNQRLHSGSLDREEADEMFRRRQHGDVLDTFVVGNSGFLDVAVPGIAGVAGLCIHEIAPVSRGFAGLWVVYGKHQVQKNRRAFQLRRLSNEVRASMQLPLVRRGLRTKS